MDWRSSGGIGKTVHLAVDWDHGESPLPVVSLILWSRRAAASLSAVNNARRAKTVNPLRGFGDRKGRWEAAIDAAFVMVDVDASAKQAWTVRIPDEPNPPTDQARDGARERPPQRLELGAVGSGGGRASVWAENGRSSQVYGVIWDVSTEGADGRVAPA
jgi:hypothetical protein